ncbi:MAG TPA: hypothetical protein VJU18_07395 [Vicinamibacteria bacterium]|nr:hypothetical protein [Vicinamibacteria bacterium]
MLRANTFVLASTLLLAGSLAAAGDLAVSVEGGYFDLTLARKSAQAVFDGSAGGATFGTQLRLGIGRSFYVALGARRFQKDGERAFAADAGSEAYRLGHPLTVRTIPVYALAGYRFSASKRLVPYAGLGLGVTSYREESTVAEIEQPTVTATKPSGHLVAGMEWGRGTLRLGVEAMFSTVPGAIGKEGVSKVYGESNVGGVTVVARVLYVR